MLYKNVDVCDLESIMEKGILSLDESGNDNWVSEKRVDNPTDCIYLFQPIEDKPNAFPNYGAALLEVDVEDAKKSEFDSLDTHKEDYIEYTVEKVEPEHIKRILIPAAFKERLNLPASVENAVEWCGFSAEVYGDNGLEPADEHTMELFKNTAPIENSTYDYFFRGLNEKGWLFELYNVRYDF